MKGALPRMVLVQVTAACAMGDPVAASQRAGARATQGGPELQDIVRGTDERPFSAHLPHPAQQELSMAAALFDLTEHWLDNRFPLGVAPSPAHCAEGTAHRQARGRAPSGRGRPHLAVQLAIRRDERGIAQRGEGRNVRLAEIPCIHAGHTRNGTSIGQHLGQHRLGLLLVIRFIGDVGGDNDLGGGIRGGLTVIPLIPKLSGAPMTIGATAPPRCLRL